jgi:hypothetical protein
MKYKHRKIKNSRKNAKHECVPLLYPNLSEFEMELYGKPQIYKTATELKHRFNRRNYMNPNLRQVRTAAQLKPKSQN